jgi:hypothetical protein
MARTVFSGCPAIMLGPERIERIGVTRAPKGRVMDDNSGWIIIGLIILLFIFTKPFGAG